MKEHLLKLRSKTPRELKGEWISEPNKPTSNLKIFDKLYIDDKSTIKLTPFMDPLKVEKLNCEILLTDSDLEFIVKTYPNLTFLNLAHCKKLTNAGIFHLQHLKKLQHLDMCFCFSAPYEKEQNITEESLIHLKDLPLKYLDLDRFYGLTDKGLEFFRNSKLEYLCINDSKITNKGLEIISTMPLKKLSMRSCKNITDNGLFYLTKLKQLNNLELHWCIGITDFLAKYYRDSNAVQNFFYRLSYLQMHKANFSQKVYTIINDYHSNRWKCFFDGDFNTP